MVIIEGTLGVPVKLLNNFQLVVGEIQVHQVIISRAGHDHIWKLECSVEYFDCGAIFLLDNGSVEKRVIRSWGFFVWLHCGTNKDVNDKRVDCHDEVGGSDRGRKTRVIDQERVTGRNIKRRPSLINIHDQSACLSIHRTL